MSTVSSKGDGRIRLEVNLGVQMPLSDAVGEVRPPSIDPRSAARHGSTHGTSLSGWV